MFTLLKSRNVEAVLVGGIALLSYVQGRNTSDLDLILAVSALAKLPEIEVAEKNEYFARGKFSGLRIDFLFTRNPLFKQVYQNYSLEKSFLETTIRIASVEGLLLLKTYALPSLYQRGDFTRVGIYENDIATLVYLYKPDIPALKETLRAYLDPSDLSEINDILDEIRVRTEKFRNQSRNE